jgi:hypothetical protein
MQSVKVKLAANATHNPRTGYNQQMWQAVQGCKGIATGVTIANLHQHLMAQVPTQSPHHCTAHIKYLLRSKGALVTVVAK